MHAVTKASSTTTKIHIVFDASTRTTSGISLNNVLLSGPNIYPLIVDQVLKFRMNKIAMSADISQMFCRILLTENYRDLHRFLFRESADLPVKEYRMKRLMFGVTSSPFIASQTLRQVAIDFADEYPIASAVVLNDFYVEDVLTGASSITTTKELRSQLNGLVLKGGFLLQKWRSNSPALLESFPAELKVTEVNTELQRSSDNLKTLGIHWNTLQDTLHVATPDIQNSEKLTKHELVSNIDNLYDIMGWLSPVILYVKSLMQQTWEARVEWDEAVPVSVFHLWKKWMKNLHCLTEKIIPRSCLDTDKEVRDLQLHGFADASEKGYAAVIYLPAFYTDSTVSVCLITSKTKVAPIKRHTIPKLELAGALFLTK